MTENEVFAKIQKLIEEHFSVLLTKSRKKLSLRKISMLIRLTWSNSFWNLKTSLVRKYLMRMLKSLRQLAMQCHMLWLVKTIRNIRERWSVWARPLLFDIIK